MSNNIKIDYYIAKWNLKTQGLISRLQKNKIVFYSIKTQLFRQLKILELKERKSIRK